MENETKMLVYKDLVNHSYITELQQLQEWYLSQVANGGSQQA